MLSPMIQGLLIGLGGLVGTLARYWLSGAIAIRVGETFPWGTLIVNVSGSLAIGFIAALTDPDGRFLVNPSLRQTLMIGVMGGYTTFSSFSLQTLTLAREGEWLYAGANVLLSVVLCLIAVWAGHTLARMI